MQLNYSYIGTGPISVIDAFHKKKAGKEVVLIDDKNQVGGAWVAIPVGEYGRLEIGCHIWSYNKKAYSFLEDFFDLDLVDLSPQPYFLKGKMKLTYDRKHLITTLALIGKYAAKLKFGTLIKELKVNPSARFPLFPKPYRYPRGGARELQDAIVKKIENGNLATQLNTQVVKLTQKKGGWVLHFKNGLTAESENVVMTMTSGIKEVVLNDRTIELEHRKLNYTHFHLIVEGDFIKALSYVRVLRHPYIHRLSDITYQLTENKAGHKVLLVGVFDSELPENLNEAEVVEELKAYLIENGFLAGDAKIAYAQKNRFETLYIALDQVRELRKLDGLEVMATTDFIYGVHGRLQMCK